MAGSNTNSVAPLTGATIKDLNDAIGITQFPSEFEWYQVIGGLIVQGGKQEVADGAAPTIAFPAPYEKQVLGLWIQTINSTPNISYPSAITLANFVLNNGVGIRTYYWWSVGV